MVPGILLKDALRAALYALCGELLHDFCVSLHVLVSGPRLAVSDREVDAAGLPRKLMLHEEVPEAGVPE